MARTEELAGDVERLPSPGAAAAVDVLVELTLRDGKGASIRELATALAVPRSTLHRVLQTLEIKQMVRREAGGYLLGARSSQIGFHTRAREIRALAMPILERLHTITGETVNLAIPHDGGMLVIAAVESSSPLRMVSVVGTLDELHASALGKSYLAALPRDEAERALHNHEFTARSQRTITDPRTFVDHLGEVGQRGYAVDDGESVDGVRCVAAALVGRNDEPIGALSVSAPAARMPLETLDEVADPVKQAARQISTLLAADV